MHYLVHLVCHSLDFFSVSTRMSISDIRIPSSRIQITRDSYQADRRAILDMAIIFGEAGQSLILNKDNRVLAPVKYITTDPATLVKTSAFELDGDGLALSREGRDDYRRSCTQFDAQEQHRVKDRNALFAFLWASLSDGSKIILEAEAGLLAIKATQDFIALWALITQTHTASSTAAKSRDLRALVSATQTGSVEQFSVKINDFGRRFRQQYESPLHPGYVNIDRFIKDLWVSGLNQESHFVKLGIKTLVETRPDATAAEAQAYLHQLLLDADVPVPAVKASAVSHGALVAPVVPPAGVSRADVPAPPGHCRSCFYHGFLKKFPQDNCIHARNYQYKGKVPVKPLVKNPAKPVAFAAAMEDTSAADTEFIQRYEYDAAVKRRAASAAAAAAASAGL